MALEFLPLLVSKEQITQDVNRIARWWGRDDWESCIRMKKPEMGEAFVEQFKKEFAYKLVKAWLIFERQNGGKIMYYMIHATDHPEAPGLMSRAYERAIQPKERPEQLLLEFGLPPDPDAAEHQP